MADPLQNYLRPGYPKESLSESSYRNSMEYVGERSLLAGTVNGVATRWGDYPGYISSAEFEDIEGTDPVYSILRVVVETKQGSAEYPSGTAAQVDEVNDEIDWTVIQRSLYEHPAFRMGGGGEFELTSGDIEEIKAWMNEPDVDRKAAYEYQPAPVGYESTEGYYRTLSDNAIMFARGVQQGIEYWNDYAPVIRRQSTYVGGGPPPEGNAGQKDTPPEGLGPPNYEWIKNADRSLKAGGQTRWRRDEEWLGAKKVLIDRDEVFWTAPDPS